MEIRTLKYFLTIAKQENMTTAANTLHVSQSALSRQMHELEKQLGKTLFIRTNRKTLLTADGIRLRQRAEEIISLVDKTEMEFQSTDDNIYGEIYIGAGETKTFSLIAKAIKNIQQTYPDIHFHIYSGNALDVTERLERGSLDFGLLFEPVSKNHFDYINLPIADILGILMPKDSSFAIQESITLEDLKQMHLITSSRLTQDNICSLLPTDIYKALNIKGSYNLLYNASLMVQEGVSYALTIDGLINTSGDSNLIFIPLEPLTKMHTIFAWKKHQLLSKAQELFLNEVKKYCLLSTTI